MTPEEIKQLKYSVAMISACLNGDDERSNAVFKAGGSDLSPFIDGTFLLAISLAAMLGAPGRQAVETTLRQLDPIELAMVPGASVNWEFGIDIAVARSIGSPLLKDISAQIDVPTALQTAFSLVVALLWALDGVEGRDPEQWLKIVAEWLVAGAPPATE
jgi:hypothetical protein